MTKKEAFNKIAENINRIEPYKKYRILKLSLILGVPTQYICISPWFQKVTIGNVYYYYTF